MDVEAVSSDKLVAEAFSSRRRSNSVSDDYSTQRTNDDATQCKYFAVQKGYWKDEFIGRFVSGANEETSRFPEISLGYWCRTKIVEQHVKQFINKFSGKVQIISLGSGFDTLFWRLSAENLKFLKFVEVDFASVTSRKIRNIMKPGTPEMTSFFSEKPSIIHHTDLHSGNYHLIGADLRQLGELNTKLDAADLDNSIPTICIAECVLVYMSGSHSSALLEALCSRFKKLSFLNYEQFRSSDEFTKVMEANLGNRGIQLHGLSMCESADKQKERFNMAGFSSVEVHDMNEVFNRILDPADATRVKKIEMLDELELLWQLLAHYCVVYAENH
ncbi:unnamed protein product [Caenorhabditis auriculariae]|uniref:Leucine carboxyl methyltransferase 1 n=1 Tax=Caenorhabditis auriculariae TaxID=2777116 RepID=A0A8S1GZ24_9PELO|nr:unnamed protein product [Caenorhabditis auriculariae]